MTSPDPKPATRSLSADEAIVVLEQADLALQASIPLPPGLRAMASESRSFRVRQALHELADRIENGEPLPAVLESLHSGLSPLMRALIQQGASVGRLDTVLHWAAEQGRRRRTLYWQLWTALTYPLMILAAAFLVTGFVMIAIVPRFRKIFEDFGTELPDVTKFTLAVSTVLASYWTWAVLVLGLLAVGFLITLICGSPWNSTRRWTQMIPLIGPLLRLAALADFCQLLAVFVELQIPLPKALRLAGMASGDYWLEAAGHEFATEMDMGMCSSSSAMSLGFPPSVAQLLTDKSSPEPLAESLHGLSDLYSIRTEVSSRLVGGVLEPVILVGSSCALGVVVLSLMLPLIKLLNDLS
ncbi:MAG: type II secretion system F family protein [Planctomycetes bacterium]|nr:type II secretion system F family protein [Planctomycetota bacterium]